MAELTQAGRLAPTGVGEVVIGPHRPDQQVAGKAEYEAPGFSLISREYPALTHLCSYASSHVAGSTVRVGRGT